MGLITIVDASDDFVSGVAQLLASRTDIDVRRMPRLDEAGLAKLELDLLVVGPSIEVDSGIDYARRHARDRRPVAVVVVTPKVTTEIMRQALRSGCADVVCAGDPATDIRDSIIAAHDAAVRARAAEGDSGLDIPRDARHGRVVTVFSMKGGVGKSVLATNLGVALASELEKRVVLVDLDLQFGDVGIMLGLEPRRTILDAVHAIDRLDADMLASMLTDHSSGLKVLLAPLRPEDAEAVTAGRIGRILDLLAGMFEYVIIDTAANFDEVVLTALDRSSEVYALTMMDVASIKNVHVALQKLSQLGYNGTTTRLVLNRADSKVWLQRNDVEKAIGIPVSATIPSNRVVPRSVNKGAPVVFDDPRSDVSRAIVGIANTIVRSAEEVRQGVSQG